MSFEKPKRVKLHGYRLRALNATIHARDNDRCIVCGCWVHPEVKFHHEPCGVSKSDEIEKGVVLCDECHFERHNGKKSREVKEIITEYLKKKYGNS